MKGKSKNLSKSFWMINRKPSTKNKGKKREEESEKNLRLMSRSSQTLTLTTKSYQMKRQIKHQSKKTRLRNLKKGKNIS